MKVAILAGGMGTRLAEETEIRPKPMVEIGGKPILWHIMRHYDHYGFNEFVVALGYKGEQIRRFFAEFHANSSNLRVDLARGVGEAHGNGPKEGGWSNLSRPVIKPTPADASSVWLPTSETRPSC